MSLANFHPALRSYMQENWKGLTEIQELAFEPIFKGLSCTIEAPTSGGKTEAVLFPLLSRIKPNKENGFKVLYIAPLKALLNDLALRVEPYSKMCYLQSFKWHGDVTQESKIKQMLFPADILLTTPESIEAILLRKGNWINVFANLETVVIDEAHYFALTERGSHLVSLLERIDEGIGKKPQRIAVTATIGNSNELLTWIIGKEREGVNIRVQSNAEKERDFLIHYFLNEGVGLVEKLYQLLERKKSIVFERSRSKTEETATAINEINLTKGTRFPIAVRTHHSSISKKYREDAENSIKQRTESSINAIISTSTLELGIDIGELDQVIQIGVLNSSGSFLQRVGRTGRRKGKPQFFRGLCYEEEELLLLTACVSLGLQGKSESVLFPKKAFHILAHQIICLCLQKNGTSHDNMWNIFANVSCFSNITHEEFQDLIKYMLHAEYLRNAGRGALLPGPKAEQQFLRANWKRLFAIFDSGPTYNVVNGKKIIGTLDSGFAQTRRLPFVFVLGGKEWNALRIDHEIQQILVERNITGIAPKWTAFGNYDIPFELAQEVGRILFCKAELNFLDNAAQNKIQEQKRMYNALGWQSDNWVLESSFTFHHFLIWTFAGDKINRTLEILIESRFECKIEGDFKMISIRPSKGKLFSVEDINSFLTEIKALSCHDLNILLTKQTKSVWFSKFSECLPDSLAIKTLVERDFDVSGFLRQLKCCRILIKVASL